MTTRITINDFRQAGICPNARHWFARHGLDWRDFVRHGVEVEKLRATNDHQTMVDKVEQIAKARANG